jgi:S-adenosylmethionine:tRNA ribosyltransferase-isomerase
LKTSDFDYDLPPEFIAQTPLEPRDASRLMVLERANRKITHAIFRDLGQLLRAGDLLVLNQTRVLPARLFAKKIPDGGKIEILLLRRHDAVTWEVLVGGKGLKRGRQLQVEGGLRAEVVAVMEGPRRLIQFDEALDERLERIGKTPLPPYIHASLDDPERYQTVFARQPGSAAAPTAGLHFTPQLLENLHELGIRSTFLTLHVGLDTFLPVMENDPQEHVIHTEWCQVTPEVAQAVNQARRDGSRIVAVGTTSVRTLESAARVAAPGETIGTFEGPTGLFILPGYQFRAVDGMITNFHLPRSTLIMLVSAFAGREQILSMYQIAKENHYRFYSFGDAMLIL